MIEEEERRHERAKEEQKQSKEDARKRAMEPALKRRCHDEFAEIVARKRLWFGLRVTISVDRST